jgi:hypothetical protein
MQRVVSHLPCLAWCVARQADVDAAILIPPFAAHVIPAIEGTQGLALAARRAPAGELEDVALVSRRTGRGAEYAKVSTEEAAE